MEELNFGTVFTDHMAHMRWTPETGWGQREVIPFGPLDLSPAAAVLHYGQSAFEGIKAYRHSDGSIWTFRPGFNAARMNHSNWKIPFVCAFWKSSKVRGSSKGIFVISNAFFVIFCVC